MKYNNTNTKQSPPKQKIITKRINKHRPRKVKISDVSYHNRLKQSLIKYPFNVDLIQKASSKYGETLNYPGLDFIFKRYRKDPWVRIYAISSAYSSGGYQAVNKVIKHVKDPLILQAAAYAYTFGGHMSEVNKLIAQTSQKKDIIKKIILSCTANKKSMYFKKISDTYSCLRNTALTKLIKLNASNKYDFIDNVDELILSDDEIKSKIQTHIKQSDFRMLHNLIQQYPNSTLPKVYTVRELSLTQNIDLAHQYWTEIIQKVNRDITSDDTRSVIKTLNHVQTYLKRDQMTSLTVIAAKSFAARDQFNAIVDLANHFPALKKNICCTINRFL